MLLLEDGVAEGFFVMFLGNLFIFCQALQAFLWFWRGLCVWCPLWFVEWRCSHCWWILGGWVKHLHTLVASFLLLDELQLENRSWKPQRSKPTPITSHNCKHHPSWTRNINSGPAVFCCFCPSRKVVLDGKTFAPFGMIPHAIEPEKVGLVSWACWF